MSAVLTIPPHERGRLHVLAVNLPEADLRARHEGDTEPAPGLLADLTGLDGLDAEGAELIAVADLEGVGLSGYLVEGHDIDAAAVAGQRARLDRIEGFALILRSQAFGGRAMSLRSPHLSHIASFDQPGTDWTAADPIATDSARPFSGPGHLSFPAWSHRSSASPAQDTGTAAPPPQP